MLPRRLLPLLLMLAVASTASARTAPRSQAPTQTLAPAFTLPARAGSVCSDSLRGRVVYVDFWASWCVSCRRSFPWLARLQERFRDRGLTVVAINLDKSRADADAFLASYPAPFTIAFDPAGKTAQAFKVAAMPSSFVISRSGTILYSHAGFDPKQTAAIETLIQEACTR